ncbi:MAG: hypothetical protein LC777_02310 [Actinobacteria bacterium]|nr:hypothetical protein [Actinomycetota bacterium]
MSSSREREAALRDRFTHARAIAMMGHMNVRGIGKRDVAIAVVLSGIGVALMIGNVRDPDIEASVLAIPLFLAVTAPLLWRRTAPVAALATMLGALLVHIALFGSVIRCGAVFPEVFLLAFAAGATLKARESVIALGLALASLIAVVLSDAAEDIISALPFVAVMAVAVWGVGRVVHSRGRLANELQARERELRAARDERSRLEVVADRAQLSSQLDELLQRRLGELTRRAEAGIDASRPAEAAAALVEIENQGRETLEQMRSLVGVLRDDDADAPRDPQPALTQLEALLLQTKGTPAQLTVEGSPRVLPPSVELSAYRIVEHLLGALTDSPDVEVHVHFGSDILELTVCGMARPRANMAIDQALQRVELHRGTLKSTVRGGRAETIVALPMLAGA